MLSVSYLEVLNHTARSLTRIDILPSSKRPSALWKFVSTESSPPSKLEISAPSLEPGKDRPVPRYTNPQANVPIPGTAYPSEARNDSLPTAACIIQKSQSDDLGTPSPGKCASATIIARPLRPEQTEPKSHDRKSGPRKFHLTENSLLSPSSYHISKASGKIYKKSQKNVLAVFVEHVEQVLNNGRAHNDGSVDPSAHTQYASFEKQESGKAQRRPNVTLEERKWRTANWGRSIEPNRDEEGAQKLGQSVTDPSNHWNYESPQLAEQLQQIALQEIELQDKASNKIGRPRLKSQPKPFRHCQLDSHNSANVAYEDKYMLDAADTDDGGVYVFDTYFRSSTGHVGDIASVELNGDTLQDASVCSFGIIVIDDDKEELWETYVEDQESDIEWNSEEEDENGPYDTLCSKLSY